jgi:hypothetical protein
VASIFAVRVTIFDSNTIGAQVNTAGWGFTA